MIASDRKRVVIVGAGFAGLAAARVLGRDGTSDVLVLDRTNHHLFQPLLYQVAMAGLSPADIAAPIRSLLAGHRNVRVVQTEVKAVNVQARRVETAHGTEPYDWLILAAGVQHAYFGHEAWEPFAPGLKTLEQATEIRRRVLTAYELAERETDLERRKSHLTFVVVGGGPTGVELAGAIGELSRLTLARDFRNIDPTLARVILIEAGPRILPSFEERLASRATRDLEALGVQVWTNSRVTRIDAEGVAVGEERIQATTVLWAAGVCASTLGGTLGAERDRQGRVKVTAGLCLPDHPEVLVLGDLAHATGPDGQALPGIAPVAMQQGRYAGRTIVDDLRGRARKPFVYRDKGQAATIGRSRAVVQLPHVRMTGWLAWLLWLVVHIYYLNGFRNRLLVLIQWAWSYVTFGRGARLIVDKRWRLYG